MYEGSYYSVEFDDLLQLADHVPCGYSYPLRIRVQRLTFSVYILASSEEEVVLLLADFFGVFLRNDSFAILFFRLNCVFIVIFFRQIYCNLQPKQEFVLFKKASTAESENLVLVFLSDAIKFLLQGVSQCGILLLVLDDVYGEQLDVGIQSKLIHVVQLLEVIYDEKQLARKLGQGSIILPRIQNLPHRSG